MGETRESFTGWAILELMGHRRLGGYLSEQEIAGAAFIRIDVPGYTHTEPTGDQEEREAATQFYLPSAVYAITPTTEAMARQVAEQMHPEPVKEWELRRFVPALPRGRDEDEVAHDDGEYADSHAADGLPF